MRSVALTLVLCVLAPLALTAALALCGVVIVAVVVAAPVVAGWWAAGWVVGRRKDNGDVGRTRGVDVAPSSRGSGRERRHPRLDVGDAAERPTLTRFRRETQVWPN